MRARRYSDELLTKYSLAGLSHAAIAKIFGVTTSSVTTRLKNINVTSVDTRKAFIDTLLGNLPPEVQEKIFDDLNPNRNIKHIIIDALVNYYKEE